MRGCADYLVSCTEGDGATTPNSSEVESFSGTNDLNCIITEAKVDCISTTDCTVLEGRLLAECTLQNGNTNRTEMSLNSIGFAFPGESPVGNKWFETAEGEAEILIEIPSPPSTAQYKIDLVMHVLSTMERVKGKDRMSMNNTIWYDYSESAIPPTPVIQ